MRSFEVRTSAACTPAALYAVSLDVGAHVASMAASGERAVGGVTTGMIGLGEEVTWSARHFGVRWRMTSRITAADKPHRFVDEQVRGPFRAFRHEHLFEADRRGTLMTDRISLAAPVLGPLAEPLVLVPYLRRLIRTRKRHLLRALGVAGTVD